MDCSFLRANIFESSSTQIECLHGYERLTILTFESPSTLQRIESSAFSWSGSTQIEVPTSIESLYSQHLHGCKSSDGNEDNPMISFPRYERFKIRE
jgi:hypothetical protein